MAVTYTGATIVIGTSVTLPSHSPGDLLLIFADRNANATPPSIPTSGGDVPAWTQITTGNAGPSSGNYVWSMVTAYAVATSSSHTSGTWTNATQIAAVSLSGVNTATPIGGSSQTSGIDTASPSAPAITLSDSSGNGSILQYFSGRTSSATFASPPSGYTARFNGFAFSSFGYQLFTKDNTSSDGSVIHTLSAGTALAYTAASIEIVAGATASSGFFHMF